MFLKHFNDFKHFNSKKFFMYIWFNFIYNLILNTYKLFYMPLYITFNLILHMYILLIVFIKSHTQHKWVFMNENI